MLQAKVVTSFQKVTATVSLPQLQPWCPTVSSPALDYRLRFMFTVMPDQASVLGRKQTTNLWKPEREANSIGFDCHCAALAASKGEIRRK